VLIASVGVLAARALGHVNEDLRVMYTEYTLAAVDLAHISGDLMRYRTTIIRALEAPDKQTFEQITAPLPAQGARIQHAVDRYAAASLRVSRSGRSEPEDLEAVRESLDEYFSSASRTISLLTQSWSAATLQESADLRHKAELHAADNAGPKVIQVSLALDHLLETVAEVAKDMRDDGTRTVEGTSMLLIIVTFLAALVNLLARRPRESIAVSAPPRPSRPAVEPSAELSSSHDDPVIRSILGERQ
jgi:hypothetical protein